MGYEIRNKKNEAAHPITNSDCVTRPMTEEEWAKYGPRQRAVKRGFIIRSGWGRRMIRRGV